MSGGRAVPPASGALRYDHVVLDNGLTVIGELNPNAVSVAAGYFVRTGARDESGDVAGVSHFLEHMMFKGTDRRTAADINRSFDELGAQYNAFTSEERTVYYGAVLPERLRQLLDLLSDMMRPALRQEDFDVEKNVILEEIAMYEDRPHFRVFELAGNGFWNGHPLGHSVLGGQDSIRALTREQMLAYFERRYVPSNLVLAVAGAYDWDAVTGDVAALTQGWRPVDAGRELVAPRPAAGEGRTRDDALSRVHAAVFAPGLAVTDERRYAAAVLANALGDDSGSRLFWALVDKGLADSASLGHEASDGAGAYVGYVSAAPERADEVLGVYRRVLGEAQEDGLGAEEWHRSQRKLATSLTLRAETPLGRLVSLGVGEQTLGRYQSVQEVVDAVMGTTVDDGHALLSQRPFDALYVHRLEPAGATEEATTS
ncbi:MAG TPA: pitrilysin family protein [Trueperaceae bacterium]|nr:pitrilysin family protein [Trueperaceae bacterium]